MTLKTAYRMVETRRAYPVGSTGYLQAVGYNALRVYLAFYPSASNAQLYVSSDPNTNTVNGMLIAGVTGARGWFDLNVADNPYMVQQAWYFSTTAAGSQTVITALELIAMPSNAAPDDGDGEPPTVAIYGTGTMPNDPGHYDPVAGWTQRLRQLAGKLRGQR